MAEAVGKEITMPKHGEFCWAEIATNDLETCKVFYNKIFGWEFSKIGSPDDSMDYQQFNLPGDNGQGGIYKLNAEAFGGTMPPPHFMNYIAVNNVDVVTARVEGLGGTVLMPPMDIPGTGRFSIIQNPTGAAIALITLIPMS